MSGGSYNYLCFAGPSDLPNRIEDLERMLDRVVGLGYANDFAAELAALLGLIRRYEVRAAEILHTAEKVMMAVEWWDSSDYSEDKFKAALAEWREEPRFADVTAPVSRHRAAEPSHNDLAATLRAFPWSDYIEIGDVYDHLLYDLVCHIRGVRPVDEITTPRP